MGLTAAELQFYEQLR